MTDPDYPVALTAGQWNKVATDVLTGIIHRKSGGAYVQTYRLTGTPAPTDYDEGAGIFVEHPEYEEIKATSAIDVYIWTDSENAVLRVDV